MRTHGFTNDRTHRCAVCEERGLSILRRGQFFGRSFEADAAKIGAQGGIDFAEYSTGYGKRVGKVLSHAGFLRALTGEKKYDIHR
jgi:hypothetical protein